MGTFSLRERLKEIRSLAAWWAAEQTMHHMEAIRRYELDVVFDLHLNEAECSRLARE